MRERTSKSEGRFLDSRISAIIRDRLRSAFLTSKFGVLSSAFEVQFFPPRVAVLFVTENVCITGRVLAVRVHLFWNSLITILRLINPSSTV